MSIYPKNKHLEFINSALLLFSPMDPVHLCNARPYKCETGSLKKLKSFPTFGKLMNQSQDQNQEIAYLNVKGTQPNQSFAKLQKMHRNHCSFQSVTSPPYIT